jgi:hypothetical protein
MTMLLIIAWLMLGCTVGVVAMSLAMMGKSADKRIERMMSRVEKRRAQPYDESNRSRAGNSYRHPTSRVNVGVDMTQTLGIDAETNLHGRNRNGLEAAGESAIERGS